MNAFNLNYETFVATDKGSVTDFIAAVTIGSIMAPNFKVNKIENDVFFTFDLPFSLSNVNVEPVAYDTRFQGVKEFIDKPYCVAGRVVSLLQDRNDRGAYDVKKDFDDFIKYGAIATLNAGQENEEILDLYVGIVNSTLTETYAPFGAVNGNVGGGIQALKIYDQKDLRKALAQTACSKAGSLSGVSMTATLPNYQTPPFIPSLTATLNP